MRGEFAYRYRLFELFRKGYNGAVRRFADEDET